MKTTLPLIIMIAFSMQLMSQIVYDNQDKSPGDIAIIAIQHPCVGVVNGIDTTLGYFSALPLEQVWPIQLSALIVNIGSNNQTNIVLSGEIVNDQGTIVYSSTILGGNLNSGSNMNLSLPDLFLPTAAGNYTLSMFVIQDEGDIDLTNNEMTRQIIEVNNNGEISRSYTLNSTIEIPTGAGSVSSFAGIKFAIPNHAEIRSLSVFIDTVIQAQTFLSVQLYDWAGTSPVIQALGEPFEINLSTSKSWIDLPFTPIWATDLILQSNRQYLVGIEAQNANGIASFGADNADFHEFDIETHYVGYSLATKIPAVRINLDYDIWAEIPRIDGNIQVYPNPVSDILHIQNTSGLKFLVLNDLSGKIIRVIDQPTSNQDIHFIGLPNGLYILKIVNQDNSGKEFIIIKN